MIELNSLIAIMTIIIVHWFADFVFQSDRVAKGKSTSLSILTEHIASYLFIWILSILIITIAYGAITGDNLFVIYSIKGSFFGFLIITGIAHWATDYYTARVNTKLWKDGDTHGFFVSIGFDQVLHYTQLFITIYLLI